MNKKYRNLDCRTYTITDHTYGSMSSTDGHMGMISYDYLRCQYQSDRKRKRNYERCHHWYHTGALSLCYYHFFMKYTQYIILFWIFQTTFAAPAPINGTGLPGAGNTS